MSACLKMAPLLERLERGAGVKIEKYAPTEEQLEFGVAMLENLVAKKKMIYMHCKNGHGRAPTSVAAYLIKKGKTVGQAIDLIKSKRSDASSKSPA